MSATAAMPRRGNALTGDELVSIVERASWLFERAGDAFVAIDDPGADELCARRLADWKTIIAAGDETRFARRLAWQGLDAATVRKALGPVRLANRDVLPAWAVLLGELCAEIEAGSATRDEDLPYAQVMAPLVASAARRLATRCGAALTRFDDAARAALERALLRRLSLWMTETLHVAFGLHRGRRISSLDLLLLRGSGERSTSVYASFVEAMLAGGLRELFLEYPAMARLVATGLQSWIDAAAELVQRAARDFDGRVVAVDALLSDSHNHGRTVAILTFAEADGGTRRLVYKPRSVAPEAAWFRLLDWMNANGAPETLRTLEVLERDGYGWVEVIAPAPLRDGHDAARFYRRCGLLLAVTYAVGANDMHFENLIASGDQPVLIDMETVLCHAPRETVYGVAADDLLRTVFFESPIRTGLLPRWQTGEGLPVDVSALGAVHAQKSRVPIPRWKDVNTDLMELAYETVEGFSGMNAAILDGVALLPNDHLDEIVEGFTAGYRFLVAQREPMLAPGGPLDALASLKVRFIHRATATYLMMLKASRQPHLLRDGVERSIRLDPVAAPMLYAEERPLAWPLVELERLAMEIEDCPYFTASVSAASIDDPRGGTIDGILDGACHDQMVARMRRLGERDLESQLALVQASFDSRTRISAHAPERASGGEGERAEPLSRDALLAEAVRVADAVLGRAIPGAARAPNWVTLRYLLTIDRNQLDPIGADLFEGRAGIALLLAALDRTTGLRRFGDAARKIADAMQGELSLMNPDLQSELLVHGASGIVSLAYVFPHLAEMLDEPAYRSAASRAARFIHGDAVAADRRYDLLSGAAGSMLALLRLARAGDDDALQRAVACGDHLLARRNEHDGFRCWRTFEERPISGFAHGNGGIAFALLRLHAATGRERFRDAALEAIAFENTTFSADDGNWRDLRWEQPSFAAGWCHGGPGIALARMEALPHDRSLAADVERGAALAREHVGDGTDHLCCGNFGRVLLLHDIGRRTSRPELVQRAESLAAGRVAHASRRGAYRFLREYGGHVCFPGLFQGISGVSWALLRLAVGDAVPDVLRLE